MSSEKRSYTITEIETHLDGIGHSVANIALKMGIQGNPDYISQEADKIGSVLSSAYFRGVVNRTTDRPYMYSKGPRDHLTPIESDIMEKMNGTFTVADVMDKTKISRSNTRNALLALTRMGFMTSPGSNGHHKLYRKVDLTKKAKSTLDWDDVLFAAEVLANNLPELIRKAQAWDELQELQAKVKGSA